MNNPDAGDERQTLDLTNCDREPIHQLGRVQSFGCLLGVSADWLISHASANLAEFARKSAEEAVGEPLETLLNSQSIHNIRNRLQHLTGRDGVEYARGVLFVGSDELYDAQIHVSEGTIVLEFEPAAQSANYEADLALVRSSVARLAEISDIARFCGFAAKSVRALTGLDRVMVYRFLPDGSGEVFAEAKTSDQDSFLGLRYPASDIPKQARALYLRNPIRVIADSSHAGVEIHPPRSPSGDVLDLSQSTLRSVSPIHLEYLSNMGVAASMSISIIVNGALWGLFACHHRQAIAMSQPKRNAADLFGQMFSLLLAGKLSDVETQNDDQVQEITTSFTRSMQEGGAPVTQLVPLLQDFSSLLGADGFGVILDNIVHLDGSSPDEDEFSRLVKFLNTAAANTVFSTHQLGALMTNAQQFAQRVSGIIAIPISRSPRDYVMFFRREIVKSVNWAGNPDKPLSAEPNGSRLSPRKSFEAWRSIVEGESEHWSPSNLRAAEQLRRALLEVFLRLTDEAARERKAAQERQELLIAELNHRVRNILGLVKGLVSQTRSEKQSIAEYVGALDHRVQALARAHDQITQENWTASSFFDMVRTELESYLLDKAGRVDLTGSDYLIEPVAFSSVALVMHEMVTNAAKYGALSDQRGMVTISTSVNGLGDLIIEWAEQGGPVVQTPSRRGFGSTIVERSIPHELNGEASISFDAAGVEARFLIPAKFVKPTGRSQREGRGRVSSIASGDIDVPGSVLIVEDNLIIAMEAESLFEEIGSRTVEMAANIDQANTALAEQSFDFVLLDINLGHNTSFGLAAELVSKGVKCAFASGYGDTAAVPHNLRDIPRMSKPYDKDAILKLLSRDKE